MGARSKLFLDRLFYSNDLTTVLRWERDQNVQQESTRCKVYAKGVGGRGLAARKGPGRRAIPKRERRLAKPAADRYLGCMKTLEVMSADLGGELPDQMRSS